VEQVLSGGAGASERGEDVGKWPARLNMVKILYIYVCEWKNDTYSNYFRNGGRGE
jgi:hypothetical protein